MKTIKITLLLAWVVVLIIPSAALPASTPKTAEAKADWKQKWESVRAGARKEGKLSVWTAASQTLRTVLVPAMKEKFGISLEITTGVPAELLQKLGVSESALVLIASANRNVALASRNVPNVKVLRMENINVYDLLKYRYLITTQDAISAMQEVYGK